MHTGVSDHSLAQHGSSGEWHVSELGLRAPRLPNRCQGPCEDFWKRSFPFAVCNPLCSESTHSKSMCGCCCNLQIFLGWGWPSLMSNKHIAQYTLTNSEMFHLAPESQEIQTQFANEPKHPSLLSCLTKFKSYIKKNYQTFLDAIPIRPKLKIRSLAVVTFQ